MELQTNNNEINTNQPLIQNETPKQEGNPFILPPAKLECKTIQEDEISIPYKKSKICYIIFILLFGSTIFCVGPIVGGLIIIAVIVMVPVLISVFFILLFSNRKLIIFKDGKNNLLKILQKNYFCCSKKYNFDLENSAFICQITEDSESCESSGICIKIINTLKNPNEIDLDNSKIKDIPLNFIQYFSNLQSVQKDNLEMKLNNMIGSSGYTNVEPEEYKKYFYKYKKAKLSYHSNILN